METKCLKNFLIKDMKLIGISDKDKKLSKKISDLIKKDLAKFIYYGGEDKRYFKIDEKEIKKLDL